MIAVRLEGRLGNQLFQYAFIYTASQKLKSSFYLDKSVQDFLLPQYFDVEHDFLKLLDEHLFSITGFKNIFCIHLKKAVYIFLKKILYPQNRLIVENNTAVEVIFQKLKKRFFYIGFFQSEQYFISAENNIRKLFRVKSLYRKKFNEKFARLYQTNSIVCVHIRRTDYAELANLNLGQKDLSLPFLYYHNAIEHFKNQNVHFVFIGDDQLYITKTFKHIKNKTIASDSEIIDFQHLLNAQFCIIANSTFSWWGAWLNNNPSKIIYAPKYFLGWPIKQQFPIDIYPKNWIQIDF